MIMKPEQQVVSLELAKQLKELGVKQDSLFYWINYWDKNELVMRVANGFSGYQRLSVFTGGNPDWIDIQKDTKVYSAFSVAELGEMLPKWTSCFRENDNKWACDLSIVREKPTVPIGDTKLFEAETEADARAKMLVWLMENRYL